MNPPVPIPILLDADYGADPLWRRDSSRPGGSSMLPLDNLPLSPELKGRLRAWADRFDDLMHTDYEWPTAAEEARWIAEGRALVEPLRAELGPGYKVEYFHDT
ncbi:MAG: hypothetical protein ACRDQZ_24530 [Mycobacteriales bacterium]